MTNVNITNPPHFSDHLEHQELIRDALRFRALMSCARIRVLGTGRLGQYDQHMGLELWCKYIPNPHQHEHEEAKKTLLKFVDAIVERGSVT